MEGLDLAEPASKRPRLDDALGSAGAEASEATAFARAATPVDDFDALLAGGDLFDNFDAPPPPEPPEEVARRDFADRLQKPGPDGVLTEDDLISLLAILRDEAPKWGPVRQMRSSALLLVYVARSPRKARATFSAEGMPLLGSVLQESVAVLQGEDAAARQEAGMLALACLMCLRALPIGRATMWEHRLSVGKAFDKLHKWCKKTTTALAAELRAPTLMLCKKWQRQPRPALQAQTPEQKVLRMKVVDMIAQGLMGIAGNSPASPLPMASPGRMPPSTTAAEVEAALFGVYSSSTPEYRQHARMLRSNLALHQNAGLRDRVLSGEISADELVKLDSTHLAPEAMQAKRIESQKKVLKGTIVEETVPLSRMKSSEDRTSLNYVTPLPPMDPLRKDSGSFDESDGVSLAQASVVKDKAPEAFPIAMVPPPTPFRPDADGSSATAQTPLPEPTPEVMATPAQDDEDEEQAALIRYLTRPV